MWEPVASTHHFWVVWDLVQNPGTLAKRSDKGAAVPSPRTACPFYGRLPPAGFDCQRAVWSNRGAFEEVCFPSLANLGFSTRGREGSKKMCPLRVKAT